MNLLALRTLCLSWLDDLNGTYFTSAQMNVFLNNAQREVQKQLIQAGENWYLTRASTTCVLNKDTYALPTDFLTVNKFEVLISGTAQNEVRQIISPATLVQIERMSMTTGTPAFHVVKKNCIMIRPIPDQAYTLYLDYAPLVPDMTTDNSLPDVPTKYQEYIAVLATSDGFLKDQRDPSMITEKKNFYLSMMKQDMQQRKVDAPRQVLMLDDDGYNQFF